MLIHINFDTKDADDISIDRIHDVIAEAVSAGRSGRHLIVFSRPAAQWLINKLSLSSRERSFINHVVSQLPQLNSIIATSARYIEIYGTVPPASNPRAIPISLYRSTQLRIFESTVLLGEDIETDCQLYVEILRFFGNRNRIPSLSIDQHGGGGSRTVPALKALVDQKRLVVCFADHDRISPFCSEKIEITRLKQLASDAEAPCLLEMTCGREIENYLTVDLLLISGHNSASLSDIITIIENDTEDDAERRVWSYFDIKDGIDIPYLKSKRTQKKVLQWIQSKWDPTSAHGDTLVIDGFGDGVIKNLFANNAALATLHREIRTHRWQILYGAKFNAVVWWFAASQRHVT